MTDNKKYRKTPMVRKFRRRRDGSIIEAIQYTLDDIPMSVIAKFILNMDVDSHVTIANEHLLDVIRPVPKQWDPKNGVATIEIVDPNSGLPFMVTVGTWIGKHKSGQETNQLVFIKPEAFNAQYEEITPLAPPSEFDQLADIIYDSFSNLEGELYQALAETAAAAVIRAGWSRKKEQP